MAGPVRAAGSALVGRGSGLPYAQMSAWTGIPEDDLAQQVQDYHRLMAL